MQERFLLDTNAYFNFLKNTVFLDTDAKNNSYEAEIRRIKEGKCYISEISRLEIISVIGKYARGTSGGKKKCNCVISESGERCSNYCYTISRKPMKRRLANTWIRLLNETLNGRSPVITVSVLPFSPATLNTAQTIVQFALIHNFGSLDAVIAATLLDIRMQEEFGNMCMITSDKGLKACLNKCKLPYWDAFKKE